MIRVRVHPATSSEPIVDLIDIAAIKGFWQTDDAPVIHVINPTIPIQRRINQNEIRPKVSSQTFPTLAPDKCLGPGCTDCPCRDTP